MIYKAAMILEIEAMGSLFHSEELIRRHKAAGLNQCVY